MTQKKANFLKCPENNPLAQQYLCDRPLRFCESVLHFQSLCSRASKTGGDTAFFAHRSRVAGGRFCRDLNANQAWSSNSAVFRRRKTVAKILQMAEFRSNHPITAESSFSNYDGQFFARVLPWRVSFLGGKSLGDKIYHCTFCHVLPFPQKVQQVGIHLLLVFPRLSGSVGC